MGNSYTKWRVHKDNVSTLRLMLGVFLAAIILSEILVEKYKNTYELSDYSFESWYMRISYIVLFFVSYRFFIHRKMVEYLKKALIIIVSLTIVMSLIEFFDIPIACLWAGNQEKLNNTNRVVLVFGNSNYYGGFCCLMLPYVIEKWLHTERRMEKVFSIFLNAGLVLCVVISKSAVAIYLMILITLGIMVYEHRYMKRRAKWGALLCGGIVLGGLLINILSDEKFAELLEIGIKNSDSFDNGKINMYYIEDISIDGNRLTIKGEESSLTMVCDEYIKFYNTSGTVMSVDSDGGKIGFKDMEYANIEMEIAYIENTDIIYVEIDCGYKDTIDFYVIDGEFYGVGNSGIAVTDIESTNDISKYYSLFTGRGYIWINTLPILKEVICLGKGSGNFVYSFKQYDYVGLLKSQGTHKVLIDRPHNMFLQYSVDIGIVGTVALYSAIAYILCGWIRIKEYKEDDWMFQVSSFSIVIYLVFTCFNDSLPMLAPYMWIMLGMNMSFQYRSRLIYK